MSCSASPAVLLIPYNVIGGLIQVAMIPTLPPNPTPEQAMAASCRDDARSRYRSPCWPSSSSPRLRTPPSFTRSPMPTSKSRSVWENHSSGPFSGFSRSSGTWFLVGLAIMGGMILCLVPGILAAFWFSLATQVVVIEGVAGFAAMKRSKQLMAGNIGTIFVLGLLIGLINVGIGFGASLDSPAARARCRDCGRHGGA